jgi:diadenylate cyclase
LSNFIAQIIAQIADLAREFWVNLHYSDVSIWQAVLDISIVAFVVYYLFSLLKGSRAVSILLGLIMISVIFLISKTLNLLTVGWILDRFFTILLVSIPIIFQQELRLALEKLGNTPFWSSEKNVAMDALIKDMVEACEFLVSKKEGALIVFQHSIPLKEYVETGVRMNAEVSKELLISIFHGKGPLHDGAVIIENQKLVAAACILPTSFDNRDKNMGTRHKAAIGVSDHTDASVIVLSEERGQISFAKNGRLERNIDLARLQQLLRIVLNPKPKKKKEMKVIYREE